MRDLLRLGSDWLSDKMRHRASSAIVYRRAASSLNLMATIGSSEFEVQDDTGFSTRVESRDYIFDRADFMIDGVETEPLLGDKIIEILDGDLTGGEGYEVASLSGQPHWRWADPFRRRLRVHTKYVGRFPS